MKKQTLTPLARCWLWLGLFALAAGGVYAIILVGARSPKVQDMLPFGDFFYTSLIVHVNLTVLVWMLSITGMLWSQYAKTPFEITRMAALITCGAGAFLMAVSPFTSEGHPLLNNYVPILIQPVFFFGLSLFFLGITLQTLIALWDAHEITTIIPYGLKCTAIVVGIALLCFYLSARGLKDSGLQPTDYFNYLFWGGGHTLQLAYTLMCLVAWLLIANSIGLKLPTKHLKLFLGLTVLVAVLGPLTYGGWSSLSAEHTIFFTQQMIWGAGISPLLIGLVLVYGVITAKTFPKVSPARNALIASFLLFTVGGAIGHLINGANVVIPAHYHGSIVGVSLALMGVVYLYIPTAKSKLAQWQPFLYGGGQLLHISGLAWSGGYGALRKTPGAVHSVEGQAAMGLMGLGGLLSIIGGLVFVIVIWRELKKGMK